MASLPDRIGRYEIKERLGKGGMGAVYLARDPVIDRKVAIKLLLEDIDSDELRARFAREVRAIGQLRHSNIVVVFDYGEDEGRPFMAMEYVEGRTLRTIIRKGEPTPLEHKLQWIDQLCDGLAYAHRAGTIHRDIKPANLMIDTENVLKILDFGIARLTQDATEMTRIGAPIGTPQYMSPEQITGNLGPVDRRSDIFAVGAVAYELLSYQQAFPGDDYFEIKRRILHEAPIPLDAVCPGIQPGLVQIVYKALEKDRERRYQTLDEMLGDLARLRQRSDTQRADTPITPSDPSFIDSGALGSTPLFGARRGTDRDAAARFRAQQIDTLLQAARRALETGAIEEVFQACQQLLVLDPDNPEVSELADQAQAAVNRQQVRAWVDEARAHLANRRIEQASQCVGQALVLDPASPDALRARKEVEEGRRRLELEQQRELAVRRAIERAEAALAKNAFDTAVQAADQALAIDPLHLGAQQMKRRAVEAIAARRRREEEERAREAAEAERQRREAAAEAERQRAAAIEAERQRREAAAEAERQRVAAIEAERRRVAAMEAERQRAAALEEERRRAAAAEAERRRAEAAEAERERSLTVSVAVAPPATDGTELTDTPPPPSPRICDDNVQFTVYRPSSIRPDRWYPMLAFAHLAERRRGAARDEPDPIEEVQRQARQLLGDRLPDFPHLSADSGQAIARDGDLRFVPVVRGVEFNPPERAFRWTESVHREEFQLRAAQNVKGQTVRGALSVYYGCVLVAEVSLAIRVDAKVTTVGPEPASASPYRRIFASYSRADEAVVEEFETYATAIGDEYLRDVVQLRSGDVWAPRLIELIDSADVFQLFWSWNAMRSRFVRSEWEHALALNRPYFVRPVYWQQPFPSTDELPPPALRNLNFARVQFRAGRLATARAVAGPAGVASVTVGRSSGPATVVEPPDATELEDEKAAQTVFVPFPAEWPASDEVAVATPPKPQVAAPRDEVADEIGPVQAPAAARPFKTARLLVAAAVVLVAGLGVWAIRRPASPAAPPAAAMGVLSLNVTPWARVDAIVRASDGKSVGDSCRVTPCVLSLPAGVYNVRASNPNYPQVLEIDVTIAPGETQTVTRPLPGFRPEDAAKTLLGGRQ